jgi:hypothetical protein
MIKQSDILEAYLFLRKNNHSIPDETLEFIKNAAMDKITESPSSINKTKAIGIEEAIAATRDSMKEGCNKWLCRVVDLQSYANKIKGESNENI